MCTFTYTQTHTYTYAIIELIRTDIKSGLKHVSEDIIKDYYIQETCISVSSFPSFDSKKLLHMTSVWYKI